MEISEAEKHCTADELHDSRQFEDSFAMIMKVNSTPSRDTDSRHCCSAVCSFPPHLIGKWSEITAFVYEWQNEFVGGAREGERKMLLDHPIIGHKHWARLCKAVWSRCWCSRWSRGRRVDSAAWHVSDLLVFLDALWIAQLSCFECQSCHKWKRAIACVHSWIYYQPNNSDRSLIECVWA